MKLTINDRHSIAFTTSQREYTDEGFLKVPGRAARTGTQQYLAKELGLTDRKPDEIVIVYRPPEEVFNPESLSSYDGADITIEHPKTLVDAKTFKNVGVGHVRGSAQQDGDFVLVDMIIKDEEAIKAVESGKVQLSAGYTALYDEAEPGADYDFIQRDIKINHVALVDRARAGAQARLFDNKPKEKIMRKVLLDSGREIEIEDNATASLVEDSVQRLTADNKAKQGQIDSAQAVIDSQAEEITELKKATSDEAISKRVQAVSKTLDNARKIAGDGFTCDSVNVIDIQRAALSSVRKNVDWADKSEAYVTAAFDQKMEEKEAEDMDEEEKKEEMKDGYKQLAQDGAHIVNKDEKAKPSARSSYIDSLNGAWKGEQ